MTSDNQNKPSQKKTASRKPASKPAAKPAVKENGQKKAAPARGSAKKPAEAAKKTQRYPQRKRQPGRKPAKKPSIKVAFIGGLNEIGKNITVFECNGDMFILDCGMAFPDGDMLGVDLVIPDFSYIEENQDRIKGLVITHGHEDHIGSIPYLLKNMNFPIYGTSLTLGLVENKLKEHNLLYKAKLNKVNAGDTISLGCMDVEMIHVNHSIPDAVAVAIHSPAGTLVHTGDFKIDCTPIAGE